MPAWLVVWLRLIWRCMQKQGNTILAMDYMDNGNLWDALPRQNKDGRHIFQWCALDILLCAPCLAPWPGLATTVRAPGIVVVSKRFMGHFAGMRAGARWRTRSRWACTSCTTSGDY